MPYVKTIRRPDTRTRQEGRRADDGREEGMERRNWEDRKRTRRRRRRMCGKEDSQGWDNTTFEVMSATSSFNACR